MLPFQDYSEILLSECANCTVAFDKDNKNSSKLNVIVKLDSDNAFTEISNIEALSHIYVRDYEDIYLNLQELRDDHLLAFQQGNSIAKLPENDEDELELALCISCSSILTKMYSLHEQFGKRRGNGSLISKTLKTNNGPKVNQECGDEDFTKIKIEPGSEDSIQPPVNPHSNFVNTKGLESKNKLTYTNESRVTRNTNASKVVEDRNQESEDSSNLANDDDRCDSDFNYNESDSKSEESEDEESRPKEIKSRSAKRSSKSFREDIRNEKKRIRGSPKNVFEKWEEELNVEFKSDDAVAFNSEYLKFLEIEDSAVTCNCEYCKDGYEIIEKLKEQHDKLDRRTRYNQYCVECKLLLESVKHFKNHCEEIHYEKYAMCQKMETESSKKVILPFRCKICEETFEEYELLSMHCKDRHQIVLKSLYQTNFHIICHERNIPFEKWCSVISHVENCRQDVQKFKCKSCGEGFSSLECWMRHVMSRHENNLTPKEKHVCALCVRSFNTYQELYVHIRLSKQTKKSEANTNIPCPVCNKELLNRNTVRQHMLLAHRDVMNLPPVVMLSCTADGCQKAFQHTRDLKLHIDSVHNNIKPTVTCKICFKVYKGSSITNHMRLAHTGFKPYKCRICDKAFICGRARDIHESVHSDARPCKCDHCGKSYKTKNELNNHVSYMHRKTQMHICDLCGVAIKRKHHFATHIKDHEHKATGAKCICQECGKEFEVPSQLQRHMNMFHNPNYVFPICSICGKKFRSGGHLNRHMGSVHKNETN